MQRAMARQAEAEREKRAKIIHAEGEFQTALQLRNAASTMAHEPIAIQLRYLQTLTKIAVEKNSTIIFPLPIDLLTVLRNIVTPATTPTSDTPAALSPALTEDLAEEKG